MVIETMPYDLEGYSKKKILIFTNEENLNRLYDKYGKDPSILHNEYLIKIRSDHNLEEVSNQAQKIISTFYSKTDQDTKTDILEKAMDMEQKRNERLLNGGIQIILMLIALSNAYNSFQSNMRARKRDFILLETTGMTGRQIKDMVFKEGGILLKRLGFSYILVFILLTCLRAFRSKFEFTFAFKEILLNINYLPIVIIFIVIILGIVFAIQSSMKNLAKDTLKA